MLCPCIPLKEVGDYIAGIGRAVDRDSVEISDPFGHVGVIADGARETTSLDLGTDDNADLFDDLASGLDKGWTVHT